MSDTSTKLIRWPDELIGASQFFKCSMHFSCLLFALKFCLDFIFCSTRNLSIREAMVTDILLGKNDNVEGVCTFFGMKFYAQSVILTTGTFMSGKIWVGRTSMPAGRAGESASVGLTENLQRLGFETDRLKTGTPARVDIRTVNFSLLEPQHGDEEVCPFKPISRFIRFNFGSNQSLVCSLQMVFSGLNPIVTSDYVNVDTT